MNHRFDIFKRLQNGNTLWITAVEGLREAKKRMTRLATISSGEYFIYLQGKGIVAEFSPGTRRGREWPEPPARWLRPRQRCTLVVFLAGPVLIVQLTPRPACEVTNEAEEYSS